MLNSPFENPIMGAPSVGEATTQGSQATVNMGSGGQGLTGVPFEKPIAANPGTSPTPNSSGIPNTWLTTGGIPNDPGTGPAAVADGVATPNTPVGNMTGGKGASNIGMGKP